MEKNSTISHTPPKSRSKNKLKLFGAEIDFSQIHDTKKEFAENYCDDRISFGSENSSSRAEEPAKKTYECKWCFKVLANSQALGGHQNAHKKERMMKKRLQQQQQRLQASRAAGFGNYIDQPFQDSFDYYYGSNDSWPSDEFCQDEGKQISFCSDDRFFRVGPKDPFCSGDEKDVHGFSLTHTDRSSTSTYDYYSNKICSEENLDLQLGLG